MRMMTAAIVAAMALSAGSVMADDLAKVEEKPTEKFMTGEYIAVAGGTSTGFSYDYSGGGLDVEATYAESPELYLAWGSYMPNNTRYEMALAVRKHDLEELVTRFAGSTFVEQPSGQADVRTLEINIYRDIPLSQAAAIYIGGGVGVAGVTIDEPNIEGTTSTYTLQALGGVSYAVTEKATLFLEGRWQHSGEMEIEDENIDLSDNKVSVSNTAVIAGIRFNY